MSLRFKIDIPAGLINARLDESRKALAKRIRRATETAARQAALEPLREQTRAAFPNSRKMPTTWRAQVYPESRSIHTLNPAAIVYSQAPKIVEAFNAGAQIYPVGGKKYLAIPTAAVPRTTGGKALTVKEMAARVGPFRPLRGKGGSIVLVADVQKGKASKRGKTRWKRATKGAASQQMAFFVLVRGVKLPKKLDVESVVEKARAAFADLLEQAAAQES